MVLMKALVYQRKSLVLILVKKSTKFCLDLHYNDDKSYLFVNGKLVSGSLELIIKMLTFQLSFVLEAYLIDLVRLTL